MLTPASNPVPADPRESTGDPVAVLVAAVVRRFGVKRRDLLAATRRDARTALARQTAIYLAHTVLGLTLTAAGRRFRRDRTTAAHACRLIESRRDAAAFDAMLAALEARLAPTEPQP